MYWNTAWNTAGGVGDIVAMLKDRASNVPGDMYWNTAWNTTEGVGDIVAMP
jgi:predicted small secreted protein